MDMAGITSTGSRTIHVVPNSSPADKGTVRKAACGRNVQVRWYEVKPANNVCLQCRQAIGWPMVVTWESQGHTFTIDFTKTS